MDILLRPRNNNRFACLECGRMITPGGMTDHIKRWHGLTTVQYRKRFDIRRHDNDCIAHARSCKKPALPKFTDLNCYICGKKFKKRTLTYRFYVKKGQTEFVCRNINCWRKFISPKVKAARNTPESKAKTSRQAKRQWKENRNGMIDAQMKGMAASEAYKPCNRIRKTFETLKESPTKPELKVDNFIKVNNLPFKYTGNGEFWVERFNPDFVSTDGSKRVILVQGCYFHGCQKCFPGSKAKGVALAVVKYYYEKNNYKVILVWEHELKTPSWQSTLLAKLK